MQPRPSTSTNVYTSADTTLTVSTNASNHGGASSGTNTTIRQTRMPVQLQTVCFSIFATLDEELFVPKGSELGFVNKLKKNKPAEKQLLFNKIGDPLTFTVCHYAGNVTYNAVGWLAKNQKSLPAEAVALLLSSSNQTLKEAVPFVATSAAIASAAAAHVARGSSLPVGLRIGITKFV
ncbi:Class V myosin, related [Eimeria maxima]|uniref:Class V myosin, related n=1 Tax=Eimeria maxima TaxID=5804 RepID=U6M8Y4_EIMMA|nr:Class V myosin, related [Eimeria maxima]CDJ60491.1 Class V myosin, related [Eimeria maxima]